MDEKAVCLMVLKDVEMENKDSSRAESKRSHEWVVDATEAETFPNKKIVKETSNDESNSEVLNPNVSPRENASSSQTVSSQHLDGSLRSGCGEIACSSTGNSSSKIMDNEKHCTNDLSTLTTMSKVILESSKPVSSCGVRRIIFKFSKNPNSVSTSKIHTKPDMKSSELVGSSEDMLVGSPKNKMELKMSKKVVLNSYPTNVKKLLSTGILEGVPVKYIKGETEMLHGVINGCGYLCGCTICNFSKVLNAFEFEKHAGCKTKHPNNQVVLANGKSIYSIVQELKITPLSLLDKVIQDVVGQSVNEKSYLLWKESFQTNNFQQIGGMGEKDKSSVKLHDFPYSIQSSRGKEANVFSPGPDTTSLVQEVPVKQKCSLMQEMSGSKKELAKKETTPNQFCRPNSHGRGKKRDNDLHQLLFMPNGLPDGAELAYYSKGQKLLKGYKKGNGVVCSCCHEKISPSQFEAHAGWATRRQPYRHIYTSNGVSLHDLSICLANGQSLAASDGDDMCTLCGEGGNLILCDGCPRAFHTDCLELQCIPEGEWYCPDCKDKIGLRGKAASTESCGGVRPITIRLTRVVNAPTTEIGGCVVCRAHDFSVSKFDERTVILCDQCEKEYHVGCLRDRGLCDLKELPKGKWFCCEDCIKIHDALQDKISSGAKVIPASLSNTLNMKLLEKGQTDEVGDDVQWRLLSGKMESPEHRLLLSKAAAIFRDCFEPIVERSGRDLIPAMVYGRNIAGQDFGGMYCAVLSVKSVVVSAGILRIFGREAAELPLVATTKENQGKGYFRALFLCIERLLCCLNVENLVLPAAEEAESIWTNKFGFRKMTEDRLQMYSKEIQFMFFKGTSMLEKAVPRNTNTVPALLSSLD